MRIAITTHLVPFVYGGGEALAEGLKAACIAAGHQADLITIPFTREPPQELDRQIEAWQSLHFDRMWMQPDHVIALKFPAYLAPHPRQSIWLLHQMRDAYELADATRLQIDPDYARVSGRVRDLDRKVLGEAAARDSLYTIAKNVSRRLVRDCGFDAPALYHPPPRHEEVYSSGHEAVIFAPSRLEKLKRQDLLIEAMALTRSRVVAVIAGDGSMRGEYERRIEELGLGQKVKLRGAVARDELLAWYANSLAVFFGPHDEDYGYVTLEAMLASRAVITCSDSGGPLEFVRDGETGFVIEPTAEELAAAIDRLAADAALARSLGEAGREHYAALGISWDAVVEKLTCSA
jgi:glycosyltransferase involved in cell wall biosynthesis